MSFLSLACTVREGKLKLYDRDLLERGLREFGDGEELVLTIEPIEARRTNAQNRFFHGPVLKAFEDLGYHKQEAKDMLALLFIPQEVRQMDGSVVLVPGHTSQLKKDEYTKLIEQCIQLAAENGIVILDAEDWLAKHRSAA